MAADGGRSDQPARAVVDHFPFLAGPRRRVRLRLGDVGIGVRLRRFTADGGIRDGAVLVGEFLAGRLVLLVEGDQVVQRGIARVLGVDVNPGAALRVRADELDDEKVVLLAIVRRPTRRKTDAEASV